MVSQAWKRNSKPRPEMNNPTKSLKKRTCRPPTKKSKRSRGSNTLLPPCQEAQVQSKQSPDWTDLPFELFIAISCRLPLKSRYILGFVCTTWSDFVSTTLPPIKRKLSSPWLLSQLNKSSKFICYHIETKLSFCLGPYPEIKGKTCIGSQDGWLIFANNMLSLHFFNPLSESLVTLPPSPTPNYQASISSIKKVIFSSNPRSPDFVVVVVFNSGGGQRFTLWKAGRGHWTALYNDLRFVRWANIYDIFRLEGSDRLHAITHNAQLLVLRFNSKDEPCFSHVKDMCTRLSSKKTLYWDWPRKRTPKFAWNHLMVITKDLNCYEVSRRINKDAIDQPAHVDEIYVDCWSDCLCETCNIHFVKQVPPDKDASSVVAERKKPLKGHSFFLGENQTIALQTKGFSELQHDCVYFIDKCRNRPSWSGNCGRYDLLVLDVVRKTIKEYPLPCALPSWPPPFWFVPMLPEWSKKKKIMDRQF